MAKDPRFNFYPDNWTGGTMGFTLEQRGAYFELLVLNFYQGPFTADQGQNRLMELCRGNAGMCAELWSFLMHKFDTDGQKFWSARLLKEMNKSKVHSQKQSERAKKRWTSKNGIDSGTAAAMPDNGTGIGNGIGDNNKKEYDFTKPDTDGDEVVFPIDTTAVRDLWTGWKRYRWLAHSARYGMMGEQADLKRLERMDFKQIESTILTAIASNWKNLYPEKNGTRTNNNGKGSAKADQSKATGDYLTEYYRNKAEQQ